MHTWNCFKTMKNRSKRVGTNVKLRLYHTQYCHREAATEGWGSKPFVSKTYFSSLYLIKLFLKQQTALSLWTEETIPVFAHPKQGPSAVYMFLKRKRTYPLKVFPKGKDIPGWKGPIWLFPLQHHSLLTRSPSQGSRVGLWKAPG